MDLAVWAKLFHLYGIYALVPVILLAVAAFWRWFKDQDVEVQFRLKPKRKP